LTPQSVSTGEVAGLAFDAAGRLLVASARGVVYRIDLAAVVPGSPILTGILAVAASGTPADATQASANPGQIITLQGSGFNSNTDVLFPTIDASGTRGQRTVRAGAVNAAGTALTVVVPTDLAVTGHVRVVGDQTNAQVTLQIVPVLSGADMTSVTSDGSSAA